MTKSFKRILLLLTSIIGCNTKSPKEMGSSQNIIIDKETDWGGNFKLHIQNKTTKDSSYFYRVSALDGGVPVGFELGVPIKINQFGEGVVFRSTGDASDNFLKLLFSIYGLKPQNSLKFTSHTSCNYTSLNDMQFRGDGQERLKTVNYIKVFFEGTGENEYAELYIIIDEPNKMIELEEKDFEYRPYVAFFLMAE